jgi:hypothetical protein
MRGIARDGQHFHRALGLETGEIYEIGCLITLLKIKRVSGIRVRISACSRHSHGREQKRSNKKDMIRGD